MKTTLRCFCWKIIFSRQTTSSCEGCWLRLLSPFGFWIQQKPFKYLTVLILPKSPFPYPKDLYLKIFLNRSRYSKNYFHAKPFGKSFNHIGKRPFFKFQSLRGKIRCLTEKNVHFVYNWSVVYNWYLLLLYHYQVWYRTV